MTAAIDPGLPAGHPATLPHMAQLDGLRAIAVSAVVFHHFGLHYFKTPYPYAASVGVRLFFVLSGFLITGILLAARDHVASGNSTTTAALKNFYVRRALRIFPIYYLTVLLLFIFDAGPARELIGWLVTYTLNWKMAAQGWFVATFPHLWSLNVEEQFYIFWPWAVLLLPRRWLLPAAIAMIAVTPLGKLAYILSDYTLTTGIGTYVGTWANLDTLGAGALLAILRYRDSPVVAPRSRSLLAVAMAGGVALILVNLWPGEVKNVIEATAQAAVFAWIIWRASLGFTGPLGAALRWKPAVFVGRISYGIYVYHLFVPALLLFLLRDRLPVGAWSATAAAVAATLLLSTLSWFLIERPFNGLKERFR